MAWARGRGMSLRLLPVFCSPGWVGFCSLIDWSWCSRRGLDEDALSTQRHSPRNAPGGPAPLLPDGWKEDLRRGWRSSVVLDEGDGRELFAELLQHDHPLQKRHVVDAATTSTEVRSAFKTSDWEDSRKGWKHVRDALWLHP